MCYAPSPTMGETGTKTEYVCGWCGKSHPGDPAGIFRFLRHDYPVCAGCGEMVTSGIDLLAAIYRNAIRPKIGMQPACARCGKVHVPSESCP